MKKYFLPLIALAVLSACTKEQIARTDISPVSNVFTVEAAPYDNAASMPTKSKFYDENDQHVTNFNIWVYKSSDGSLVNNASGYTTYFNNQTEFDGDAVFPDPDTKYDIYMFSNVGKLTPPANKTAADAFKFTFSSYDSFSSAGFPMAAHYCFTPSDPNQSHSLKIKRLVSKYTVSFKFDSNDYTFSLKSAVVKQAAKSITPFADSKATSSGDILPTGDELDVNKLSSAAGQELYILENIQGNVLSSSTERSEKNITTSAKGVTSFLEFSGTLDKKDGTGYEKVTCRYYFGSGKYCGTERNVNVPLTLTMTNSVLNHDDWTVTPENPYNDGQVVFSSPSISFKGDGAWNTFSTTTKTTEGTNENIKYTLSYNASDWSAAGMTLQYRKGSSGSWSTYSGQELTGSYNFQVKSSYSGSSSKVVTITASAGGNTSTLSIVVVPSVHTGDVNMHIQIYCGRLGNGSITITNTTLSSTLGLSFTSSETTAQSDGWEIKNVKEGDSITHSFRIVSASIPTGYKLKFNDQDVTSGSTLSETFNVVYENEKLHLDKALLFTVVQDVPAAPPTDYSFSFSATNNCGYTIEIYDSEKSNCLGASSTFTRTSNATVTMTGTLKTPMTMDDEYYIRVVRIYGSTQATILKYNGTKLGDITGSGYLGPYKGSDLLFKNGDNNKLSLTLTAN